MARPDSASTAARSDAASNVADAPTFDTLYHSIGSHGVCKRLLKTPITESESEGVSTTR